MPQHRRKIPFSNKKKKDQLLAKRQSRTFGKLLIHQRSKLSYLEQNKTRCCLLLNTSQCGLTPRSGNCILISSLILFDRSSACSKIRI
uniref:Uncharacterized protein n=1 Tax=Megaselia scalaris TaxID=36166 RepID=T1H5C8_MEGSC